MTNNMEEFFDAEGRLIKIRNAYGLEQTLTYSTDGNQFLITDPQGDTLLVTLDASRVSASSVEDAQGRLTLFNYDGPYLRDVTYPNDTTKQYLYELPDRPWLITGIIDENGNRSHTVEYDAQGRAIMSELGGGAERVEVSYNLDGTTTLTNALGKRTTFHFETLHGVKKVVHVEGEPTATCQGTAMDYTFDANGFVAEEVDAEGVVTRYTRDGQGLELSRTEAVGLAEERIITTEWDSTLRKPLLVTEGNTKTRYSYDSQGRTLSRTVTDLTTGASRTRRYRYNSQGLLASVDGPREGVMDITTYRYDDQGRLAAVINALGHTTDILARDAHGRPTHTRDANGVETLLTYDASGRLHTQQRGGLTTTMTYDAVGSLTRITRTDGVTLNYHYDTANRLIGMSDQEGNHIDYTLDAMGNRTEEAVYDAAGQLARQQQQVFDELGRLLRSIGADGQTHHYGYDRNDRLTETFDPHGQLHEQAYDSLGRLIRQQDPLGGITEYGYDAQDNLARVTDPNGNTTRYVYDGLGNLIEQHSPDTGTTTYTYDAAGNVLSKTDAMGQTTHYQYDALNRLDKTLHTDGSEVSYYYDTAVNGIGRLARIEDTSGTTAWQYDEQGRRSARIQTIITSTGETQLTTRWHRNDAGQLSGMTYPTGLQVAYQYNQGKVSGVTLNGEPLLTDVRYQPFGPLSGWTWSNGRQSLRGYDLDGRLIRQTLASTERTLAYDAVGNITAITDPATNQAFSYDELDRLIAANSDTFNLSWEYDANGNRLYQSTADTGTPYTLDSLSNRLLAVDETDWQYDANGNLIQDDEHSYHYGSQNRLTTVDEGATATYRYNAQGQRVYKWAVTANGPNPDLNGDGLVTEADLHRLQAAIDTSDPAADLNGDGRLNGQDIACIATLIGETKNRGKDGQNGPEKAGCLSGPASETRLFAYDEWKLLGEYRSDGSAIQETVWLGNLPVATVQNGNVYPIHADHLGTPRVITNKNGTEVWRWDSDPFGTTAANEDPDGDGRDFEYNLRFPGQYFDGETGLHYNYFRDYDPATGSYIQSDPVGTTYNLTDHSLQLLIFGFRLKSEEMYELSWLLLEQLGLNQSYGYVNQNPINQTDILGLWPSTEKLYIMREAGRTAITIARGRQIRKVEQFCKKWGGKPKDWQKRKGWDQYGDEYHWYTKKGSSERYGWKRAGEPDPF